MEEEKENKILLLTMMVEELGSPGIVVNPDIAGRTPCRCYHVDGTDMCFSKGIIGTLSKAQIEAYCPSKEKITSQGMIERVKKFKEAARIAHKKIEHIPKGERLHPWLEAMGEELRKKGIKV